MLLEDEQRALFEKICQEFGEYTDLIPISFITGECLSTGTTTCATRLLGSNKELQKSEIEKFKPIDFFKSFNTNVRIFI